MIFLLFLLAALVLLGWWIGSAIGSAIEPNRNDRNDLPEQNITINNYITEQHLHITSEELARLKKKN